MMGGAIQGIKVPKLRWRLEKISASVRPQRIAALILALSLCGCASWYQPKMTTLTIPAPVGMKGAAPVLPVQVTTFEQWTSLWSAVCGALVTYQNGQPAQMIPGNCSTPLTMLAGAPVNIGLAAALIPLIK